MRSLHISVVLATFVATVACDDDTPSRSDTSAPDASDATTPDVSDAISEVGDSSVPDVGEDTSADAAPVNSASATIPTTGGTIMFGGATLTIPDGALSVVTQITVTVAPADGALPDGATLRGMTFDFGPDGTEFRQPATLTLPVVGTPAAGEVAVVSWFDERAGAWVDLASQVSGGEVTAEVAHFTLFVVRFVGAPSFDCAFTPCGGAGLEGTWEIAGFCIDRGVDNPFAAIAACADAVFEVEAVASGEATFAADGTFTSAIDFGSAITLELSGACVAALGMTCEALGPQFSGEGGEVICATSGGDCSCSGAGPSETDSTTGTWSVDGDTITTTAADGEPHTQEICVSGDVARIQDTDVDEEDGSTRTTTLVLSRK